MKKIISCIVLLAMCIACFAGCASQEVSTLDAARDYLHALYKDADVQTPVDYTVVSQLRMEDAVFSITWTADVAEDLVKITAGENNMTIVDINETPAEEVHYNLTATLSDEDGQSVSVSFKHTIPKGLDYKQIVEQAYTLEPGQTMDGIHTLEGVISQVNTPWDSGYKNITVTIQVEGIEEKPIQCYRLKGQGAEYLQIGDIITVTGSLTNYNGTIEFAQGCELLSIEAGAGAQPDTSNPPATNPPVTNPPATNPPAASSAIVLYFPKDGKYVTGEDYLYTSSTSGNQKHELVLSDSKADALKLTVINNSDNTVSFEADGKYLYCDGNNVQLVTAQDDYTKFVLEDAEGGKYIKCAVANYNGRAQYLEVYSGYLTCYSMGSDTSLFVFTLENA